MTRPCDCTTFVATAIRAANSTACNPRLRTFYFDLFYFFESPINTPLSLCPRHGKSAAKPINTSRSPHKRADRYVISRDPTQMYANETDTNRTTWEVDNILSWRLIWSISSTFYRFRSKSLRGKLNKRGSRTIRSDVNGRVAFQRCRFVLSSWPFLVMRASHLGHNPERIPYSFRRQIFGRVENYLISCKVTQSGRWKGAPFDGRFQTARPRKTLDANMYLNFVYVADKNARYVDKNAKRFNDADT